MSSSKIQEYNLDPNMGLAKESSVQEVLSTISNNGSSKKYICKPSDNVLCTVVNSQVSVNKQQADHLTDTNGLTWIVPIVNIYGKVKITVSLKSSYNQTNSYGAQFFIWNIDGSWTSDVAPAETQSVYNVTHKSSTYTTYTTELYVGDGSILVFRLSDWQKSYIAYCNLLTISGTLTEIEDGKITALQL